MTDCWGVLWDSMKENGRKRSLCRAVCHVRCWRLCSVPRTQVRSAVVELLDAWASVAPAADLVPDVLETIQVGLGRAHHPAQPEQGAHTSVNCIEDGQGCAALTFSGMFCGGAGEGGFRKTRAEFAQSTWPRLG